jgi:hypothetical protein
MGKNKHKKLTYGIPILITNGRHAIVGDEPVASKEPIWFFTGGFNSLVLQCVR